MGSKSQLELTKEKQASKSKTSMAKSKVRSSKQSVLGGRDSKY